MGAPKKSNRDGRGGQNRKPIAFVPAKGRKLYERQPRETQKAWEGFLAYRNMEARTQVKAAAEVGKHAKLIQKWATRWGWRERIEAYDNWKDSVDRAEDVRLVRAMRRKHAKVGELAWGLGARELGKRLKQSNEAPDVPILGAPESMRLVTEGAALERLSRGEPSEIVETKEDGWDLSKYTLEELLILKRLRDKE